MRYAKLRPDRAAEALKLAHLAADYLISISQPDGAPLAMFAEYVRDRKKCAQTSQ